MAHLVLEALFGNHTIHQLLGQGTGLLPAAFGPA